MACQISLLFDVEDPFNLDSDDATLEIAELVHSCGVRATFCVSGLKCRVLEERGRKDVIEALKPHALGLHTDTHSLHPTTMEMLENKGWADGVEAALESEGRGMRSFELVFERKPCCWGGAGNTWGPQITEACRILGIPAVLYSQFAVPNLATHHFLGVISLPTTAYLGGEDAMETLETAQAGVDQAIARVKASPAPWAEVFGGHPSRYRYLEFWDAPFFAGQTPIPYTPGARRSDENFKACMANLRSSILRLKDELEIVGVDQIVDYNWQWRQLTEYEKLKAIEGTTEHLKGAAGWPPNHPNLDTSRIIAETMARIDTLKIAESYA